MGDAITRDAVRRIPLDNYGIILFLVVNVYLLWGVALPTSSQLSLDAYDSIIAPYRFLASTLMAAVPLAVLLATVFRPRCTGRIRQLLFPLSAGFSVTGYLCLVTAATAFPNSVLFGMAGAFVGFGNACCFLLWGMVLTAMDSASSTFVLLLSGGISGFSNLALFSLPTSVAYPAIAILLVVCLFMLHSSLGRADVILSQRTLAEGACSSGASSPVSPSAREQFILLIRELGRPLLCVVALGLVFNAFREMAFAVVGGTALVNAISMLGLILGTTLVLAMLVVRGSSAPRVDSLYPYITVVVAACLVAYPFMGPRYELVFTFLISCVYLLADTLMKATMAEAARGNRIHPLAFFGAGDTVVFSTMAAGTFLGMLPREGGSVNQVMYVVAIALICVYFLMIPLVAARRRTQQKEHVVIRPLDKDELSMRCERLASRHGVTQSELVVMEQLAMGRTVSAISESLNLSENTIRSHCKSLYRKLDIHSKQELIDSVCKG